jgi:hypothetical protein
MDAGEMDLRADLQTACDALIKCYDDGARSEALLRAFIAERNREPHHTEFWVNVYRLIVQQIAFAESPSGPARA